MLKPENRQEDVTGLILVHKGIENIFLIDKSGIYISIALMTDTITPNQPLTYLLK